MNPAVSTVVYLPGSDEDVFETDSLALETDGEELNEKNWRTYAASHYQNPQSIGDEEFEQDVRRLKYVKKALTRYRMTGELCERLVLNHIVVMCNVFGHSATVRLVFLKLSEHLELIKPFLVMLNVLPKRVTRVAGRSWNTDDIAMDSGIVASLRKI